ncbi:heavy-metal-associated domain-containing protein [Aeropyrum camini]|uniref:heavy-metal-associated domain-containing protein n=1 Tax=Aeropyrum camini TaxID=229980 RepID=UPI0009E8B7BC|nr:heavy-metal-associated domain-containing protein [Aeropyrum camini]
MKRAILKIEGMYCEGCAYTIERFLKEVDGVIEVDITYPTGIAAVVYDENNAKIEDILNNSIFSGNSSYKAKLLKIE